MCSHYQAEKRRALLERHFGAMPSQDRRPEADDSSHVYPTQFAPIIRRPAERDLGDEAVPDFEMVDARFGLLPTFAKDVKYGTRTYNARSETAASLASFKGAWAKPRHCIVPCEAIYEPDWRTGTHVPTRFTASNDGTLGVAGLWQPWHAPTGEWVDTFTMLTLNADDHELMRNYHRPDPSRPPEMQDKRMVVILPEGLYEAWLDALAANARDFMRQYPADRLVATPEPVAAKVRSPKAEKPARRVDQEGLF